MKFLNIILPFILTFSSFLSNSQAITKNSLYIIDLINIPSNSKIQLVNDQNITELSAIHIEPSIINYTTTQISVSLNATTTAELKSLWLEVCDDTVCYTRVNMTYGEDGRWNTTVDVSNFIESISELHLKVTVEYTEIEPETHLIGVFNLSTKKSTNSTSNTTSSVSILSILLLLSSLWLIKRNRN